MCVYPSFVIIRGHLNFLCGLFPEGVKRPELDFKAHV